jgi:hypothetical protein
MELQKKPYQLQRSEESRGLTGVFLSLEKPQEVLATRVLENVEDGTSRNEPAMALLLRNLRMSLHAHPTS